MNPISRLLMATTLLLWAGADAGPVAAARGDDEDGMVILEVAPIVGGDAVRSGGSAIIGVPHMAAVDVLGLGYQGEFPPVHAVSLAGPPRVYFDFATSVPYGRFLKGTVGGENLVGWAIGPRGAGQVRVTLTFRRPAMVMVREDAARGLILFEPQTLPGYAVTPVLRPWPSPVPTPPRWAPPGVATRAQRADPWPNVMPWVATPVPAAPAPAAPVPVAPVPDVMAPPAPPAPLPATPKPALIPKDPFLPPESEWLPTPPP